MPTKYEIYQLEAVAHPYWLPDFQNVFSFSIDYVLESVRTVVKGLADTVTTGDEDNEDWTAESKTEYVKKLASLQPPKIKVGGIEIEEGFENLSPEERFRIARMKDLKFEKAAPTKSTSKSLKGRVLRKWGSNIW